jgi:SSS family solute:Na+ symporter
VFLLGLFYSRTNAPGAITGLVLGFAAGMGKLAIEILYKNQSEWVVGTAWLESIGKFSFLYASGVLFGFAVFIVLAVSKLTSPPDQEQIEGLTFAQMDRRQVRSSWGWPEVVATLIVLGATAGFYVYFSFWI